MKLTDCFTLQIDFPADAAEQCGSFICFTKNALIFSRQQSSRVTIYLPVSLDVTPFLSWKLADIIRS